MASADGIEHQKFKARAQCSRIGLQPLVEAEPNHCRPIINNQERLVVVDEHEGLPYLVLEVCSLTRLDD
jgi:hypothetical protein